MAKSKTQIVVIGAGYAGLLATVRLAGKLRKQNAAITLVNATDIFVERLRLHQFAANQTIPQRSIPQLLQGTGVTFTQGFVACIEPAARDVVVETKNETRRIAYEYLVYALGSTIDRERVTGVRENAYTLAPYGERDAMALRRVLPALNEKGGILVVCGGGATGIEAAAEFAEAFPKLQVKLITRSEFGMFLGKSVAEYMRATLTHLGVTIQDRTTVAQVFKDSVQTVNGARIPCDACLWAGGFAVPSIARDAGLQVNERGQILIDPFMRSISHPEIYAVGDAASPVELPGAPVRMSAFTAVILGAHGADSLSATLQNKTPAPLSFAYMGQGIALGRHNAIGFNNYPDDKPNRPYFTGRAGYEIREWFVRFLADLPQIEKRVPGFFYWLGKSRYAAAKRRAQKNSRLNASA